MNQPSSLLLLREAAARGRGADLAGLASAAAHNLPVHTASDAVVSLVVHLGHRVHVISGGLLDIPHRGRVDHVAHLKALDRLILRGASVAAVAHDGAANIATSFAVPSMIAALLPHLFYELKSRVRERKRTIW